MIASLYFENATEIPKPLIHEGRDLIQWSKWLCFQGVRKTHFRSSFFGKLLSFMVIFFAHPGTPLPPFLCLFLWGVIDIDDFKATDAQPLVCHRVRAPSPPLPPKKVLKTYPRIHVGSWWSWAYVLKFQYDKLIS